MAVPLQTICFSRCHNADLLPDTFQTGIHVYHSPAAESLFKLLRSRRRCSVLDFGPLNRDNIELLTQFYCKLFIEDFHQGLPDPELSFLPDCPLDVVLCWDMFNYLDRKQAERLIRSISSRMAPDGILIMHLGTGQYVAKVPLEFRLVDREHLACEATCRDGRPHSALTSRTLQTTMVGWKPEHSVQLRNALQEHCFLFTGK